MENSIKNVEANADAELKCIFYNARIYYETGNLVVVITLGKRIGYATKHF